MITQFYRYKPATSTEAGYIQSGTGSTPSDKFILPPMPDVDTSTVSEADLAQVLREIRGVNTTSSNNSNTDLTPTQQPAANTQPVPVRKYNTTPAVNSASIHQGIANQASAMQLAPMNHQSISRIDAIKNRFARKSERLENRQQRQNNRLARKTARVQRRFN